MNQPALSRLGAACGGAFAIVLTVAAGNGGNGNDFSGPRAIAGVAAITLALPFVAYLYSVLRTAEGTDGWLAPAALVTGVAGIVLKLSSGVPELAAHQAHLGTDTQLGAAVHAMADGATIVSLYPLAAFCAATAIVAFRTRALPRWLAAGAAVSAVALAANAGFLGSDSVPALLVFLLWTLVTSVYLLRRAWRRPTPAASSRQGAEAVASA